MNLNSISIHRFQVPKKGELILTFNWPKFFKLRIFGYLMNLYSVSIQRFSKTFVTLSILSKFSALLSTE